MKYLRAVVFAVSTILIYLGSSLLGWGIDDIPGFFALYPRVGYVIVVIGFGLAVGYQAIDAPEGISGNKGESGKLIRRQTIIGSMMTILAFGMLVLLPWADRRSIGVIFDNSFLRWLGLVFSGTGYWLIFWSGLALGKMYSAEVTIQKDHQLITFGLYRYVRHPRYLGLILVGLGLTSLFRSGIGLVAFILLVGLLLLRIQDEEKLMYQEFGVEWQAYCQRSWHLIPYVY